ncbi:MAG TPA: ABC transporter substrate-binding protein [Polyangia bacterium]|nr:ABC transporter substrate-binding protein [Polyangia bacterium]
MNQLIAIAVVSSTLIGGTGPNAISTPAHPSDPMAQLVQSTAAVKACLGRSYPSWSPEAEMQRSVVKRLIGGSMDYAEMSRRALGDHWSRLSREERSQFVAELGRLIESRSLARGMYLGPDCQIHFDKEAVTTRGTASVFATVLAEQKKKKTLRLAVEYRLLLKGDRWVVYDLVTDGKSLLESYRAQFDKVITRESFSALLQKIRQRADRGDPGLGGDGSEEIGDQKNAVAPPHE